MKIEPFVWNGRYDDLEQVARFMTAFLEVFKEVQREPGFAYNDDFRGRIPGIAGTEREDTAIYLLQGLKRQREQHARVEELLAAGYQRVEQLDTIERFEHVVLYAEDGRGEWAEFRDARLIPERNDRQAELTGPVRAVLPKGKRTYGHLINGRKVLALR